MPAPVNRADTRVVPLHPARELTRDPHPLPERQQAEMLRAYAALINAELSGHGIDGDPWPHRRAEALAARLSEAGLLAVTLNGAVMTLQMWGVTITTTGRTSAALRNWQAAAAQRLRQGVRP